MGQAVQWVIPNADTTCAAQLSCSRFLLPWRVSSYRLLVLRGGGREAEGIEPFFDALSPFRELVAVVWIGQLLPEPSRLLLLGGEGFISHAVGNPCLVTLMLCF